MIGEPIPQPLIDVIQHIILSHHGEPEFGAARIPSTPEAIAVHVIENLDAKLMMALTHTRGEAAGGEGNWTEYLKAFNGRLYRPDVAPADVLVEDEPRMAEPAENPVMAAAPVMASAQAAGQQKSPAAPVKVVITNPLFERDPGRKH
jgi:hypothetical protein